MGKVVSLIRLGQTFNSIDNIQQIADGLQKGLWTTYSKSLMLSKKVYNYCSGGLRNELYSNSFYAVLAWSCGQTKCQCCKATRRLLSIGNAAFSKSANNNKLILKLFCNNVLKKVALIMSSLFDKFKRNNFLAPFLQSI